jgi:hypothetical protein
MPFRVQRPDACGAGWIPFYFALAAVINWKLQQSFNEPIILKKTGRSKIKNTGV